MDFLIADSSSMNLIRTRWLFGAVLLAAAALGVLTLRWLLARCAPAGGGLKAALRGWWDEEIWLGGPFWAERREQMTQSWFTGVFLLFMLRWLLGHTLIPDKDLLCRFLCDLLFLSIAVKLLVLSKYSAKQLARAACFVLPMLLAAAGSGSQFFMFDILFLFCVKDVDLRRAFKAVFWVMAVCVAAVILLAAMGAIPTLTWNFFNGRTRNSFGFGHPNSCGRYLLYLASGWVLLRFEGMRWWDWLPLAGLLLFCNNAVDSRAASLCILFLLAASFFIKALPRLWQAGWVRRLGCALPLAAAAASFGIAFGYRADVPLWHKLDLISNGRVQLYSLAAQSLPLTLFGQNIVSNELYTLDNLYLSLFYGSGIIVFILYMWLLSRTLQQCWKQGWNAETILLLCLALYGCLEGMGWPSNSAAVLLYANIIYRPRPERLVRFSPPAPDGVY